MFMVSKCFLGDYAVNGPNFDTSTNASALRKEFSAYFGLLNKKKLTMLHNFVLHFILG
jgi:hypothetical protein